MKSKEIIRFKNCDEAIKGIIGRKNIKIYVDEDVDKQMPILVPGYNNGEKTDVKIYKYKVLLAECDRRNILCIFKNNLDEME